MQNSYNKYGCDKFIFLILELIEEENNLILREQFWMDKNQSYDRQLGFNISRIAITHIPHKKLLRKLTIDELLQIEQLLRNKVKSKIIVELFDISYSYLCSIKHNKSCKFIEKKTENYRFGSKGENNPAAKIFDTDVDNIRYLYNFLTTKEISEIYSLKIGHIRAIIEKRIWKHLEDDNQYKKLIGENHYFSKLSEEDVKNIRLLQPFLYYREIAELYSINRDTVTGIINGRTWKHIEVNHTRINDGKSKLKDDEVKIIKKLLNYLTHKEIAEIYNVKRVTISSIAANTNWKHIQAEE